ncbi:hypothetical protein EVAR_4799_1 [Eumeta japonica]|uniref:Uncharacterized protein n=1 Tax=Eumeta variegata TaxID=151549 RepID=A0A4C1SZX4_EUMVA|nr:hypothetical protein EVAR_4799_1 [Eumeta japonica]
MVLRNDNFLENFKTGVMKKNNVSLRERAKAPVTADNSPRPAQDPRGGFQIDTPQSGIKILSEGMLRGKGIRHGVTVLHVQTAPSYYKIQHAISNLPRESNCACGLRLAPARRRRRPYVTASPDKYIGLVFKAPPHRGRLPTFCVLADEINTLMF